MTTDHLLSSNSGRFLGMLAGSDAVPKPTMTFMIQAGYRLYQDDRKMQESFTRGFYRGMTDCGRAKHEASLIIDQATDHRESA